MTEIKFIAIDDVLKIIDLVRNHYAEDLFTPPPESKLPDCYSAAGARLACDNIKKLLLDDEKEI